MNNHSELPAVPPEKKNFHVRILDENFNVKTYDFDDPKIVGLQVARKIGITSDDYVILEWLENFQLENIRPDEEIDLCKAIKGIFVIKGTGVIYQFLIDGLSMLWPLSPITGLTVKRLVGKDTGSFQVYLETDNIDYKIIEENANVPLSRPGVERFKVVPLISIYIDKAKYLVAKSSFTGSELKALAGISMAKDLFLMNNGPGDDIKINDDQQITVKNEDHFYSLPKDLTPGNATRLLEADENYLRSKGYNFEVTGDGVIIHNFSLPASYSPTSVDLLILLPAGYPNARLDMFWTSPCVTLKNGQPPKAANVNGNYSGRTWQRWSRHWPSSVPWQPGIDGLDTFLSAIRKELDKGI